MRPRVYVQGVFAERATLTSFEMIFSDHGAWIARLDLRGVGPIEVTAPSTLMKEGRADILPLIGVPLVVDLQLYRRESDDGVEGGVLTSIGPAV